LRLHLLLPLLPPLRWRLALLRRLGRDRRLGAALAAGGVRGVGLPEPLGHLA
jgi:hypothetical protein